MKLKLLKILIFSLWYNLILSMEGELHELPLQPETISSLGHELKYKYIALIKGNDAAERAKHMKFIAFILKSKKEQAGDQLADLIFKYHNIFKVTIRNESILSIKLQINVKEDNIPDLEKTKWKCRGLFNNPTSYNEIEQYKLFCNNFENIIYQWISKDFINQVLSHTKCVKAKPVLMLDLNLVFYNLIN